MSATLILVAAFACTTSMFTTSAQAFFTTAHTWVASNGSDSATTVLDSNITGATLTLSGGRILTYGNNSTIGTPGSGFTATALLN